MKPEIIIIILLIIWNLIVFFMYWLDKWKSKNGKWRISERTLILIAVIMGSLGAFMGMQLLRHKTKHLKFKIGVPVALIFNMVVIFICLYLYLGMIA